MIYLGDQPSDRGGPVPPIPPWIYAFGYASLSLPLSPLSFNRPPKAVVGNRRPMGHITLKVAGSEI